MICGRSFTSKGAVTAHIKEAHTSNKLGKSVTFQCTVCMQKLDSFEALQTHCFELHTLQCGVVSPKPDVEGWLRKSDQSASTQVPWQEVTPVHLAQRLLAAANQVTTPSPSPNGLIGRAPIEWTAQSSARAQQSSASPVRHRCVSTLPCPSGRKVVRSV